MIFDVEANKLTGANGAAVTLQGGQRERTSKVPSTTTRSAPSRINSGIEERERYLPFSSGAGTITLAVTNNTIQKVHNNASI